MSLQVVVAGNIAVLVPAGLEPSDVARWINPGLLSDEYQVLDLITLSARELEITETDWMPLPEPPK